jgi:hypothetical protein
MERNTRRGGAVVDRSMKSRIILWNVRDLNDQGKRSIVKICCRSREVT